MLKTHRLIFSDSRYPKGQIYHIKTLNHYLLNNTDNFSRNVFYYLQILCLHGCMTCFLKVFPFICKILYLNTKISVKYDSCMTAVLFFFLNIYISHLKFLTFF